MNDRISLVLRTKNITPSQLADEIGVQRSGVSHILNGRNKPSLDFIQKLLKRYPDISMAWLMLGEGAMMNPYPASGVVANKPPATKAPLMDLFQLDDEPQDEESNNDEQGDYYDDELQDIPEAEEQDDDEPVNEIRSRNSIPGMETANKRPASSIPGRESASKRPASGIPDRESASKRPASGIHGREITRIVIFYSDKSFTEYYPGNE